MVVSNLKKYFQDLLKDYTQDTDGRFTKVEIRLMHLGRNYNGSVFKREVVERAIPSLANIPILGFIEENYEGDEDFSDHRFKLIVEDGDVKEIYLGAAYGIIPETNNARFEKHVGEDGIEREYLVVDGLLWNKFHDRIDIIRAAGGIKSNSMELFEEYDGEYDEDFYFVFSDFKFEGTCILGKDFEPAMVGSSIKIVDMDDELEIYSHTIKTPNKSELAGALHTKISSMRELLNTIDKYGKFDKIDIEQIGNALNTFENEVERVLDKKGMSEILNELFTETQLFILSQRIKEFKKSNGGM